MIPQTRTHLRRDRTPNRKYIENNLYEIHKRLKLNGNKPIAKTNNVVKPPKRAENEAKLTKKLRKVTSETNGYLNLKLAPANFITKQRAQKSVDYQRAQKILELDSNQNIVDQLKLQSFAKIKGKFGFSVKKNDKKKLRMASDVLYALGLVPVSQSSNSEKMHLLEEEEEEGGGLAATKTEGDGPLMTSRVGGVNSRTSSLLRNKSGGVTNGDLPETPPSDMDEEEKEEELADTIHISNGNSPADPLQQEEEEEEGSGNGDTSTVDEKVEENEVKEAEDGQDAASGEKDELSTTEKCETHATPEAEEKIENVVESSSVKDADKNQKEETKPARKSSTNKCQSNKTEVKEKSKAIEKSKAVEKSKTVEDEPVAKDKETTEIENTDKNKDVTDRSNPAEKDPSEDDVAEESSKEIHDDTPEKSSEKEPEIEPRSVEKAAEDSPAKVASVETLKDTENGSKIDEDPEIEEESSEDPSLDEKDGILTIGGKVVELAPPPEPVHREDKFNEFMLANNMEITICKTPLVGGAEIGHLRRSSSSSSKSGRRSLSPANDQRSGDALSSVGKTGDRTASPASSVDGSRTSVSEAELMLASVSDGEITITKSGGGSGDGKSLDGRRSADRRSADGRPVDAKSVDGRTDSGGKSELRMMRRSDLKRSLSSEVWRGEESGGGSGGEEVESKRAHMSKSEEEVVDIKRTQSRNEEEMLESKQTPLGKSDEEMDSKRTQSRNEEEMVTEEYEPDLTEPLEGDEDERERLVRDFVSQASSSLAESLARLKREIHVLSELAQAKELEWNSVLRLRKLKEEMWERLSRKVRVDSLFSNKRRPSTSVSPSLPAKCSKPSPSTSPSVTLPPTSPSLKNQRLILPKPTAQLAQPTQSPIPSPNTEIILAEGRQGKIKDVQAIINDYRSKTANEAASHPNPTSKVRSRRSSLNTGGTGTTQSGAASRSFAGNPSLLSMANLALGSGGGQVRSGGGGGGATQQMQQQQLDVQLNYLGNVQVQRHPQMKGQSMPLPPVAQNQFPEVTLHPVLPSPTQQQNSLLHGILTKTSGGKHQQQQSQQQQQQQQSSHASPLPPHLAHSRNSSFSPTLARLLTLPERQRAAHSAGGQAGFAPGPAAHFSASQNLSAMLRAQKIRGGGGGGASTGPPCSNDIVASLKQKIVPQQSRHHQQQQPPLHHSQLESEITITPVTCAQVSRKEDPLVHLDDEDENDRLVIDEARTGDPAGGNPAGGNPAGAGAGGLSNGGDAIPECQGCHRNSAQFVCAGCGNQWYCSRECQVAAWEDHSDVCSG